MAHFDQHDRRPTEHKPDLEFNSLGARRDVPSRWFATANSRNIFRRVETGVALQLQSCIQPSLQARRRVP